MPGNWFERPKLAVISDNPLMVLDIISPCCFEQLLKWCLPLLPKWKIQNVWNCKCLMIEKSTLRVLQHHTCFCCILDCDATDSAYHTCKQIVIVNRNLPFLYSGVFIKADESRGFQVSMTTAENFIWEWWQWTVHIYLVKNIISVVVSGFLSSVKGVLFKRS